MDLKEGLIVGRKFRLLRPLAQGGMGAVWEARHAELETIVAVKFMQADESAVPNARARFEREAKAAAQLKSPHVVQIIDYGVDDGTPYIVMERLEGEDLRARLDRVGSLPLAQVAAIVLQLGKALGAAHDAGIIHRDIKPSNVFLARMGGDEIVKMLDFGVAKETRLGGDASQTTSGHLLGSPAYMSPEQARGGKIDHRSDLWSLGVLTYLSLAGRHPFEGENLGDMLVNICTGDFARLLPKGSLPPALDAFFERAFCRSPDGRFASAHAFSEELLAIAEGRAPDLAEEPTAGPEEEETAGLDELGPTEDVLRGAGVSLGPHPGPPAPARVVPRHDLTGSSFALGSERRARAARGRGWIYGLVGAAAVGSLWLAQLTLREPVAAEPVTPARTEAPPAQSTSGEAPRPAPAPAPAEGSSATPPAAPPPAAPSPQVARPVPPRVAPSAVRPPTPPKPSAEIDPKYGLPRRRSP